MRAHETEDKHIKRGMAEGRRKEREEREKGLRRKKGEAYIASVAPLLPSRPSLLCRSKHTAFSE
eukprot:1340735-Rhodomonas_salina.2